jgi:molybdopterin converting factor small subunit
MKVLFFHTARELTGLAMVDWPITGAISEEEFWQRLGAQFPNLLPLRGKVRLARNEEYMAVGESLQGSDEVALIPPVSGG